MEIKTNNMKKAIQITVLLLSFLCVSCEEVWRKFKYRTTKISNRSLYQLAERNWEGCNVKLTTQQAILNGNSCGV
jgi:hypothetical protein